MTDREISVLTIPRLDVARDRAKTVAPAGQSVAAIVRRELPMTFGADRLVRVTLNGHLIEADRWERIYPKAGTELVIRVVAARDTLRAILQVVVTVAAIAIGNFVGGLVGGGFLGGVTSAVVSTGIVIVGNLLINALIPVIPPTSDGADKQSPSLQGFQNRIAPRGTVPSVAGFIRYAPPYAAPPYTEIDGDDQYLIAAFDFGYGPLDISGLKLGDTSIDDYDDLEYEVRQGYSSDEPLRLYPQQVYEQQLSTLLTYPVVESTGLPVDGATEGKEVIRVTAADAQSASVDFVFPQGLVSYTDQGKKRGATVVIRIRYRLIGTLSWTDVATLNVSRSEQRQIRVAQRWDFPARGRYEIGVTRMNPQHRITDDKLIDDVNLSVLRSFRPEYPINFPHPLALVSLRIKATDQLNGVVNNLNAMCKRIAPDYDTATGTWVERVTQNPASFYRYIWQGNPNAYPKEDSALALDAIQDWHDFCRENGLTYNRVHDYEGSLWDALKDTAAAGRATPQDRGDQWSVVVDTPRDTVVAHITPRNSWGFQGETAYPRRPDAFRVAFLDETNDYASGERIVERPDHVGTVTVTEEINMPGKTAAAEVYVEAMRRWYEIANRRHIYTVTQDMENLQVTRGDLVMLNSFVLAKEHASARIAAISGSILRLDDFVSMEAGGNYGVRIRLANGDSLVRAVHTVPGEAQLSISLIGPPTGAAVGDLIQFGSTDEGVAFECIVTKIEPGQNFTATLTMVDHAPQIETLTDAVVAPAWDGRVGEVLGPDDFGPPVPTITALESGTFLAAEDAGYCLVIRLTAGAGSPTTAEFEVRHRPLGATVWVNVTIPAAEGAVKILAGVYALGDQVEIEARGISYAGITGDWTDLRVYELGESDETAPDILTFTAERIDTAYWQFTWTIETGTGIDAAEGVEILYAAGIWPDINYLAPLHTGLLTTTPWLVSIPDDVGGSYTFGIQTVTDEGAVGAAYIVTVP